MRSPFLLVAAFVLAGVLPVSAQVLDLQIANGKVTLDAQGVSLRQILARWTQVGGTLIVNSDKVSDVPVTMHFVDAPERTVLAALLRDLAGYMLAGPTPEAPGSATVGRILIFWPTSADLANATPEVATRGPVARPLLGTPRQPPAAVPFAGQAQTDVAPENQPDPDFVRQPLTPPAAPMSFDGTVPVDAGGFVTGMTDDRGKAVRGPTTPPDETAPQDPGDKTPTAPGVRPNPFGVTSGSSRPMTPAPSQP